MKKFKIIYIDKNGKIWLRYVTGTWSSIIKDYDNNGNTLEKAATFGKASIEDTTEWNMATDMFDASDLLR